ncbi:MAG: HAD-IIB family hydrolase [Bacteroidales bacterium]
MTKNRPAIIALDYDGTLAQTNGRVGETEISALEKLGKSGIIRVVATGRSLFSADEVMQAELPIDYLVFSSGVGIMHWPERNILAKNSLDVNKAGEIINFLKESRLSFMVHHPAPDNHHFYYHEGKDRTPDFHRRIERYREFALPLEAATGFSGISQLLVVIEYDGLHWLDKLRTQFPEVNVVRTTSPLDHSSMWIEIFPKHVSKAGGLIYLADKLGISHDEIWCVGNDYNDIDMLRFGGKSFVVNDAPDELKNEFNCIGGQDKTGVAGLLQELSARHDSL